MFNNVTIEQVVTFLAKFAEKSQNVYWLSSMDFAHIYYVSPAYETIWGRSRDALYANPESWIEHLHPEDRKNRHPIHAMAKKVKEQGINARYDEFYRIIRPDGEIRWITDHGFPVYIDGQCYGITGVAIDISHEKQVEEDLRIAMQKAEVANQAKTHFLAKVSHELRTPLNGILGTTQLLANKQYDPELQEHIKDIEFATTHLLNLVNDILDFSCFEEGQIVIRSEPVNLPGLAKAVIASTLHRVHSKKVRIVEKIDKNIPSLMIGDSFRIRQILLNLVNNAIKFTAEGTITVTLSCLEKSPTKAKLHIAVEDAGVGIAEDMQEKIFDRFFQVDAGYSRAHEGVGLGLAISQQIAKAMNSKIYVKSSPGKGSLFWLDLEMEVLTLPENNAYTKFFHSVCETNNSYDESFDFRTLVVEDNPLNQKILNSMLTELGCRVDLATDGKTVLEIVKQETYDIIFMDVGLPYMDGLQVTREIRKLEAYQNTPIIGVTAHAFEADIQACRDASMNEVLIKPVTVSDLKNALTTWGKMKKSTV